MIWRLIEHDAASGPWNMAVDEALLAAASDPAAVPVLRVYGWKPECLSLGLSQARQDVNLEALRDAKIDLVRRPTGGSAIFHTRELTYSVSAPANHPLMIGGVLESYKRIAAGLSRFLSSLGLQSQTKSPAGSTRPEERDPVCFDRPAIDRQRSGAAQAGSPAAWLVAPRPRLSPHR